MSVDRESYKLALHLQKEGKYQEAITAASKISQPEYRAGILIDSGAKARKIKEVREGIRLLETIVQAGHKKMSKASLFYNIANGYISIYTMRRQKGANVIAPNDDDLRKAKKAYRTALAETKDNPAFLRSQVWVNYGNCLSSIGRCFEAIQAYDKALELDSLNGMAAGNLGIEIKRVLDVTGRYKHHYILAAHNLLKKAIGTKMYLSYGGHDAKRDFEFNLKYLQKLIDAHEFRLEPLKRVFLPKKTAESCYLKFCLKNKLFLNTWVGDQSVTPSISDDITYGTFALPRGEKKTALELFRILNEIKESFSTARYLYFLATSHDKVLDSISGITAYCNSCSADLYGLYTGLCKAAYVRAFDVLDKVARIANIYFKIGKRMDCFWHLFAEKQSRGESHELRYIARPAIVASHNYSLYALSDICIDYFESEHVDLKTIDIRRNLITHDYLAIIFNCMSDHTPNANEVSADEFYRKTLAVLKLAKYAVLYAVSSVRISENRRVETGKRKSVNSK